MARIDGIIILDSVGKPLITSHFASHPASYAAILTDGFNHEYARAQAAESAGASGSVSPVFYVNALRRTGGVSSGAGASGAAVCHLLRDGLRYLVPLSDDVNPLLGFAFLESFLDTLTEYLGDVTEVTVKDNFDIVYMLIEEMLDEGHPMTMETNMLKDIVIPPSLVRKLLNVAGVSGLQSHQTAPFSAPIPWRRQGIRHANNEIYFDVTETLDAIVDRRGRLVQSKVWGSLNCNSRLSGNPDLILTFADSKVMKEPAFHPCIRYSRWEKDGALSFIPPDGRFKLLGYDGGSVTALPLHLKAQMSVDDNGGKFIVTLMSRLASQPIEDITITCFLGPTVTSVSTTHTGDRHPAGYSAPEGIADGRAGGGTSEFDPHTGMLKWSISSIISNESPSACLGTFVSNGRPMPDPAFTVTYTIPNYTYSNVKVDQLRVVGDVGYKPFKGVRTKAQAGKLEFRW